MRGVGKAPQLSGEAVTLLKAGGLTELQRLKMLPVATDCSQMHLSSGSPDVDLDWNSSLVWLHIRLTAASICCTGFRAGLPGLPSGWVMSRFLRGFQLGVSDSALRLRFHI